MTLSGAASEAGESINSHGTNSIIEMAARINTDSSLRRSLSAVPESEEVVPALNMSYTMSEQETKPSVQKDMAAGVALKGGFSRMCNIFGYSQEEEDLESAKSIPLPESPINRNSTSSDSSPSTVVSPTRDDMDMALLNGGKLP